ncbi:Tim17/Tim22/Tim23/Pmp24 family-domain-containing protein [Phialemonium atrogriseum]|uniref:Tim17/Tim22/Tim23/Pmp24 family-domain-containing protein n=1 Tax=Phialemonium atrogriseum TaxID=1093897 RepID=A0AAJ0BY51_9PEZI|nr:Tim17/Tim22/Tim23/Pmp24 family-domain-containing protein [Phialemonium atrogriseum]KAK1766450.1 Tim17/Tim22/Tim23/Pmp24 family-domain-containing protein [Phialemonium atrogriseum]
MAPEGDGHYHPKDAVSAAVTGTIVTGSAGLFVSAIQNSLQKRNVGAWGIFTRTGGTIATFAAVGGAYEFSRNAAANLREKDDHYNAAIGGFLAGSVLGLRTGRIPPMLGWGALTATVLAVYEYTGGALSGSTRDKEVDEFERKEYLRRNRRRPLEETIADVGEGRSIYPPGYEERRRERLKEKYGVDINPVSVDPNA